MFFMVKPHSLFCSFTQVSVQFLGSATMIHAPRLLRAARHHRAWAVSSAAAATAATAAATCYWYAHDQSLYLCEPPLKDAYSKESKEVRAMMDQLQAQFVERLERIPPPTSSSSSTTSSPGTAFAPVSWLRDNGKHGGGTRFQNEAGPVFNRASVNVSAVHYETKPKYPIDSATALSVILHPEHPFAPSMHFHLSYMEPRGAARGGPYWRMIADLNPSNPRAADTAAFEAAMAGALAAGSDAGVATAKATTTTITITSAKQPRLGLLAHGAALYEAAKDFGDKYFWIPALGRSRGAAHVFVGKLPVALVGEEEEEEEAGDRSDKDDDTTANNDSTAEVAGNPPPPPPPPPASTSFPASMELAHRLANVAIETYSTLVEDAMRRHPAESVASESYFAGAKRNQLAYHTVYLFQVLTLDRGTTHGLLAHNQNDVGTLGSLPRFVDRALLERWAETIELPPPQDMLLQEVISVLPDAAPLTADGEGSKEERQEKREEEPG